MARYAENTSVPVEKSRAEIESILNRYGATSFLYATQASSALIQFDAKGRRVRFVLPLPDRSEERFSFKGVRKNPTTDDERFKLWEQACRQRWRSLALAIKAKLETVECGISEFEQEFLAHIVDPSSGKTVGEVIRPMIEHNYQGNPKALALPYYETNDKA